MEPFQQQPAEIQHLTGFETCFTTRETAGFAEPPPKYKMFVVVWIAVFCTVLPLIAALKPMTASLPPLLASALLATISVASMTWVILPSLSWEFRGWLYPKAKSNQ